MNVKDLSYEEIKYYLEGIDIKRHEIALSCLEDSLILIEECLPSEEIELVRMGKKEISAQYRKMDYVKIVIECLKVINNTIHEEIYKSGITVLEAFIIIMIRSDSKSTPASISDFFSIKRKDIVSIVGDLMDRGYIQNYLLHYNEADSDLKLRGVCYHLDGMILTKKGICVVNSVRCILIDDDESIISIIASELLESINTLLKSKFDIDFSEHLTSHPIGHFTEVKLLPGESLKMACQREEDSIPEIVKLVSKLAIVKFIVSKLW